MTGKVEKLTISVPKDLIEIADRIARERGISRSKVVTICLQEYATDLMRTQMAEGYRALSRENREFAGQTTDIAHEILPEWDE
jgi:metal-responsive CopG/Arc/MetJ family transcriptional regulator